MYNKYQIDTRGVWPVLIFGMIAITMYVEYKDIGLLEAILRWNPEQLETL